MKAKSTYTLAKLETQTAGRRQGGRRSQQGSGTDRERGKAGSPRRCDAAQAGCQVDGAEVGDADQAAAGRGPRDEVPTLEPGPSVAMLEPLGPEEAGYNIDEIREISRGFFGTISTELGSVLEYAFSSAGRPDGYVLGTEGGGAFLAGLRYGSGTLYMRAGGSSDIYWHGPSIGTDIGASGSRTMFLIYRVHQPEDLYRQFTGIDGSAYFIGGVGITFLKGGERDHGADPHRARIPHRRQHRLHPLHTTRDVEPVLTGSHVGGLRRYQVSCRRRATRCCRSRRRTASS